MTPMPQSAIAEPCFSRGYVSSSTACDSGTRLAPSAPCSARNTTSSVNEFAAPQSIEASVKPMTARANKRLRPKRSARTPVSGVKIAAATMYEVSTQEI